MPETPGAVTPPADGSPEAAAAAKAAETAAAAAKDPNADPSNILDDAAEEAKAAEEAENKRLLDTPDDKLEEADKTKKAALIEKNKAAEAAKGAPEKYEDFKVPEGFTLDKALVEKAAPIFKELGLSQEKAQKLVDLYSEMRGAQETAQAEAFKGFVEGLKQETIKTLGANYKEELAFAAKSRDRFFSPATIEKLNASGLSNDKDLIADVIKLGRSISEDHVPGGPASSDGQKTPGEVLYPTSKQ
ncbi:MAG: hypothetical protein PHT59_04515 [Candidatus Omnitrophica bacterium]|nr:hypothetical protein [Candidatus Omnitrophota bacterium]